MKYFTMKWWQDSQHSAVENPFPAYKRHIEQIRDQLPDGLLELQESVSLHDATLRWINIDPSSGVLAIHLDGDDGSGGLRKFELNYSGVVSFESISDRDGGFSGPHGYGDLGYDEADILEDSSFEHCILFSSGIEFKIHFTRFILDYYD